MNYLFSIFCIHFLTLFYDLIILFAVSRSRSKTDSVNSVDRVREYNVVAVISLTILIIKFFLFCVQEKLAMSKFSINSEVSQNESSMFGKYGICIG